MTKCACMNGEETQIPDYIVISSVGWALVSMSPWKTPEITSSSADFYSAANFTNFLGVWSPYSQNTLLIPSKGWGLTPWILQICIFLLLANLNDPADSSWTYTGACDSKRDPERKWDLVSWVRVMWVPLSLSATENLDLNNFMMSLWSKQTL